MKKSFYLVIWLFSYLVILSVNTVHAQEATPTPGSNIIQKKIDDLKERLATRVAELKTQNKKAFYGVIKEKNDGKIVLSNGDITMTVTYDKDIKIAVRTLAGKKSDTDDKMLTVGSNVVAFGTLDLDQKTILAKYLLIHDQPIALVGTVKSVDTKVGSFVITGTDGETTLEYEINTKCRMWDGDALVSCGLSKVKPTDKVIVRMTGNNKANKGVALRIVLLPTQAAPDATTPAPTTKTTPATTSPAAKPTTKPTKPSPTIAE